MSQEQELQEKQEKLSSDVKTTCEKAMGLWQTGEQEAAKMMLFEIWFRRAAAMMQMGEPFRLQDAKLFNNAASVIEPEFVIEPMNNELVEALKSAKREIENGNPVFAVIEVAAIKAKREAVWEEKQFDIFDCFAREAFDEVIEVVKKLKPSA